MYMYIIKEQLCLKFFIYVVTGLGCLNICNVHLNICNEQVICLYGFLRPTREFFHSYGDVNITVEVLTYTRH